jgi:ABC-type multidrug transport system fused ATPase/permease subunit
VAKHHPLDLKEGKSPKAKINRENLRQALVLFKYLKPHRGKFILGMVFIALTAFSTSLFPLFLGKMIDAASPGAALPGISNASNFGFSVKKIHWSLNTALLLIFCQLTVQTFFSFMRVYLLTAVGEKSLADMRRDVYSKLLSMPMSFFTEKRVGELTNRISSDLSQIQDAISFTLAEFLRGVFMLIIGLGFIFWISSKLALGNVVCCSVAGNRCSCIWKTDSQNGTPGTGSVGRQWYHCAGNFSWHINSKSFYE